MPESPEAGLAWAIAQGLVELVVNITIGTTVPDTDWTPIHAYTVPAGKTFYLTDFYPSGGDPSAGFEFMYNIQINQVDKIHGRLAAGLNSGDHLRTPLRVTEGQIVRIRIYHWAGSNKSFHGTFIGFLAG